MFSLIVVVPFTPDVMDVGDLACSRHFEVTPADLDTRPEEESL